MRLEALAAGVLEVDLLLVEDGSVAVEELGNEVEEALAVEGLVEARVEVEEVLEPVEQPTALVVGAHRLGEVHHPLAGRLGPRLHVSGPLQLESKIKWLNEKMEMALHDFKNSCKESKQIQNEW